MTEFINTMFWAIVVCAIAAVIMIIVEIVRDKE